ncbi:TetR/AcrR family transcriptional regulator [Marivita sp.]|jgi:AcrR family transcriptional regulator|uniref:TetR/AcrR family transcriptional regulator n=1 Tax=Roseobacteraceae TaxID=2854170 RepID=UPI003218E2A4|nr:TetR/AcrR family transcriptional regulator [Yoonia sp.]MDC0860518.1 TetR/AcrR family transcriptional regulator [Planktomarina temperata]
MGKTTSQDRILHAARRLFFEHGFGQVSTDVLAREAAVSKATIYRHFENMADILRCVTEAEALRFREITPPKTETIADLQTALIQYGTKLLTFLNEAETLEFARLMHEGARENPDIGETFFNAAYGQTQNDFAKMFAAAQNRGVLSDLTSPMDIAEDLIGLLEGLGMVRVQLGVIKVPYPDVQERTTRAVNTILKMHATSR